MPIALQVVYMEAYEDFIQGLINLKDYYIEAKA